MFEINKYLENQYPKKIILHDCFETVWTWLAGLPKREKTLKQWQRIFKAKMDNYSGFTNQRAALVVWRFSGTSLLR
jgi:hypothetical protein